jgi:hypothetical protein
VTRLPHLARPGFGHRVGPVATDEARDRLLAADVIEVWT